MPIIKTDHQLETVQWVFDPDTGDVTDLILTVNVAIMEDGKELTRVRRTVSKWADLTPAQQNQADVIGKRLKLLAATV